MMLAQFKQSPKLPPTPSQQSATTGTQVHDRSEAFALMEELKKRQRPFEKLRLAQAQEATYREEAEAVDTMLETLDSIALAETETGVIPPEERGVLKKSLHQALRSSGNKAEDLTEMPLDEAVDLETLQTLLTEPKPLALGDKECLLELGSVIAQKLAEQLNHKQLAQQAFGLNQLSEDKLVLCKYLQQLLDEVQKLRAENESLTTQLNQYRPAGLGLYRKSIKKV
jgi:hypothetical protein